MMDSGASEAEIGANEGSSTQQSTRKGDLLASIVVDKRGNAFDVDSTGKHAIVASNALYIIQLEDLSKPEVVKIPGSNARPDLGTAAWNPHSQTIAAANKSISVWKFTEGSQAWTLHCTMEAHKRAVTDLAWSPFRQNILATRSADCCFIWDVRQKNNAIKKHIVPEPVSSGGVIRWNRHDADVLATTKEGIVQIWDLRNISAPVEQLTAHTQAITDLDWDYNNEKAFLTGAGDKTVKFWDTSNLDTPKNSFVIGVPVVHARYTPFGEGVVTLGRGQTSLALWTVFDLSKPVHIFKSKPAKEDTTISDLQMFCWRVIKHQQTGRTGLQFQKAGHPAQYHLVSWGRDWCMNVWNVNKKNQEACFFTKSLFGRGRSSSLDNVNEKVGDGKSEPGISDSDPKSQKGKRRETFTSKSVTTRKGGEEEEDEDLLSSKREYTVPSLDFDAKEKEVGPTQAVVSLDSSGGVELISNIDSSPSPPTVLGSPHSAPLDLRQEFTYVTQYPVPNLTIEVDPIDKSCVATYTVTQGESGEKTSIFLKVSFPSFYPHARPSFHFLPGTTIAHQRKLMLLRGLNKIAQFNMQHSRPCLRQSLLQLVRMQDYFTEEERQEREAKQKVEAQQAAAEQATKEVAEKAARDVAEKEAAEVALKESADVEARKALTSSEPAATTSSAELSSSDPKQTGEKEIEQTGPKEGLKRPSIFNIFRRSRTQPAPESEQDDEEEAIFGGLEIDGKQQGDERHGRDEEDYQHHSEEAEDAIPSTHPAPEDYHRSNSMPISKHRGAKDHRPKNPLLAMKQELSEEAAHKAHQHQVETLPFLGSPVMSSSYLSASPLSRLTSASELLSMKDFQKLTKFVPARYTMSDWKLVYSTMQHGISLPNFYRHAKEYTPTILVVEDSNKHVFGAFLTGRWELALDKPSAFSGTGESFLFTIAPKFSVYKWSTMNEQFMMCEPDFIAIGGGHNVGLWLDSEFENGCSKRCDTFLNNPLASSEDFTVVVVELWALA